MKHIVVTGSSSGIGFETVGFLIEKGYFVFGCVRTEADAQHLLEAYPKNCKPLIFDLADEEGIIKSAEIVQETIGDTPLFGLVNNAAAVVSGPIAEISKDAMRHQFEVNTFGPLNMCQVYFPLILGDGTNPGRIVNVTSISGEIAMPFLGPYSASKRALMSLTHTLRREFLPYGVEVIDVVPGRVKTGIVEKLVGEEKKFIGSDFEEAMRLRMESATKMRDYGLEPIEISKAILTALTAKKPKTRYVKPDLYFKGWKIPTTLPARLVDRVLAKQMNLLPQFLKKK